MPLTMVEGTPPPGGALPPPPQRATPARKGTRCGAGAGSPRPHRPHPGHTGRGTLAARWRRRAAGGGTAPDTRRSSQRWQATPSRGGPPPAPRHAAPTGHAGQGDSVGPPHPHTRAHSTWVADPNSPPSGRAVKGGTAPDLRHPLQMVEGTPPGDALPPPPQRATPARKAARCGAGAGSPRPHQPHPGHTGRGTPAARSRGRAAGCGTAPDTRRPSQRWQATPPEDAPPPPPRHAAPTGHAGQEDSVGPPHPHTRAHSTWVADPNSPPSGRAVKGGTAPDLRRPTQWWKAPPPGTPFRHPHSKQRRPARAHAVGLVLGPHACTDRTRNTRVAEPWLPAPEDGRPGDGQRLTPDAPHNGGRPPPPGDGPPTTPAARSYHRACRPRGQCWAPTPTHPRPQHVGAGCQQPAQCAGSRGRDSASPQTLLTMVEGTPFGDALPLPPQQATPACKGARCGAGAGSRHPHRAHPEHTGRGTLAARSRGRAAGGGTAPDTRRPSQRWQASPPKTAAHHPRGTQPPRGMQAKGTVLGPHNHTPAPTARGWWTPTARPVGGQSPEGQRLTSDAPDNGGRHPPRDDLPPPPQRATPARKGARCGAGAGSPRPHRRHPGHTGRGTLAARPRGRAAGGGTSPDTRRPSQRWQANPPGDGPPPAQRHAAPTGHAGQRNSVGPPLPHTRARSTWGADPNSPPSGRAVGGGTAPDLRRL